jgi:hypothetical protein
MILKMLSKKTKGGLFVGFDILEPTEDEINGLAMEPPGELYARTLALEEEMRSSGEIRESPDTGFLERIEPMSDSTFLIGGYFELRDEATSERFMERLAAAFPDAEADTEYQ